MARMHGGHRVNLHWTKFDGTLIWAGHMRCSRPQALGTIAIPAQKMEDDGASLQPPKEPKGTCAEEDKGQSAD